MRENEEQFRNLEELSPKKQLLHDLQFEKNSWQEEQRAQWKQQGDSERGLMGAREAISEKAFSRKNLSTSTVDDDEEASIKNAPGVRHVTASVLEEVSTCILKPGENQKVFVEKHIAMDDHRVLFEEERAPKVDKRFSQTHFIMDRQQEVTERRQQLDKKELELEETERKNYVKIDREERKEEWKKTKVILAII